jgi:hypothetical protein
MDFLLGFVRRARVKRLLERYVIPALDLLLAPATVAAALLMKALRRTGVWRLPVSRAIFDRVGVFPIRDHYYEPFFHPRHLRVASEVERELPGIDFDVAVQLDILDSLRYEADLASLPRIAPPGTFAYDNPNFGAGDSEFLYGMVRRFRPTRILEIGSGYSTLMMLEAVSANRAADPEYRCSITCVEPYEMEWLDRLEGVEVLRQTAETLDAACVRALQPNDILFIDSSHVVRPQGDVVHEYLRLLPAVPPGVLVHLHDIFTPRDYPRAWLVDEARLWTEQYLFEAFMTFNRRFRIVGALNYLAHRHPERLAARFPMFRERRGDPGSMWLLSL